MKKYFNKRSISRVIIAIVTIISVSFLIFNCKKKKEDDSMKNMTIALAMIDAQEKAAISEVASLAEKGYEKSMIEDPNNKCQHCHYNLHATWKESQHGNSWKNQMFQLKYQGFLKDLMGKVPGNLTAADATGKAKVCLNCHAPAAIYSNDLKIAIEQKTATNSNHVDQTIGATKSTDVSKSVTIAGKGSDGKDYAFSYHVGNSTNREGTSCAYCHSIETVHMTTSGDTYTSTAGKTYTYNSSPKNADMNEFFAFVGPVVYKDDVARDGKSKDGRHTLKAINVTTDATAAKYYAGGPYYGPYGATGIHNEHPDDKTLEREKLVNAAFNTENAKTSHFSGGSKKLCLSCHQRSAGAADPTHGGKLELCITKHVTTDSEKATESSPNCTSCHMEKRTGIVLNKWKKEGEAYSPLFLPQGMATLLENKQFSSHAWEAGNSKTKLAAGISTSLAVSGSEATAVIQNLTAHAFPGAHPMRRVVLMVRAFDDSGNEIAASSTTGSTEFTDTTFKYNTDKMSSPLEIAIKKAAVTWSELINGLAADVNGTVNNQRFGGTYKGVAVKKKITELSGMAATPYNKGLVRIYGRETSTTKALTPANLPAEAAGDVVDGFLSNTSNENRLMPNEKETYKVTFAATPKSVEYRVYYLKYGPRLSATATTDKPANLDSKGWPIDGVAGVKLLHSLKN